MQVNITGTVKIGSVLTALSRLGSLNIRGALLKLRRPMHKDQRQHRDLQRGPRGQWAPLASITLQRYARAGIRRNRRILAKLPNPRLTTVTASTLIMKSRVRWSMAHQDGPTRVGRGAVLPQRQFLWISRGFLRDAARELNTAMHAAWNGRKYP